MLHIHLTIGNRDCINLIYCKLTTVTCCSLIELVGNHYHGALPTVARYVMTGRIVPCVQCSELNFKSKRIIISYGFIFLVCWNLSFSIIRCSDWSEKLCQLVVIVCSGTRDVIIYYSSATTIRQLPTIIVTIITSDLLIFRNIFHHSQISLLLMLSLQYVVWTPNNLHVQGLALIQLILLNVNAACK